MARFTSQVNVGENLNVTYKISASVTDNDVNKPVKLSATDKVELCNDGDAIYGFINSVERATADGLVVVGVQIAGRRHVTTSGTVAIGEVVEAATNPAVGVILTTDWGIVSTKTAVAADLGTSNVTTLATELATDADGTALATAILANAVAINALTAVQDTSAAAVNAVLADMVSGALAKEWVMISGVGTTGLNILVELQ